MWAGQKEKVKEIRRKFQYFFIYILKCRLDLHFGFSILDNDGNPESKQKQRGFEFQI